MTFCFFMFTSLWPRPETRPWAFGYQPSVFLCVDVLLCVLLIFFRPAKVSSSPDLPWVETKPFSAVGNYLPNFHEEKDPSNCPASISDHRCSTADAARGLTLRKLDYVLSSGFNTTSSSELVQKHILKK